MDLEKIMRPDEVLNILIFVAVKSSKGKYKENITATFNEDHSVKIYTKSKTLKVLTAQEVLSTITYIVAKGVEEHNGSNDADIVAEFNPDHSVKFNINNA